MYISVSPVTCSSASYHMRRSRQVAAASGPHRAAGWGPPSSQSPGWFPPADRGWPRCPPSWGNSHRSERKRWPLGILCLCWLHLNYVSGWMSYPWNLDSTKTREWGNDLCEMKVYRGQTGELEMLEGINNPLGSNSVSVMFCYKCLVSFIEVTQYRKDKPFH